MAIKNLVKGILTFVPGLLRLRRISQGPTVSSRYCYSVWLRHLVHAAGNGLSGMPGRIAELGPGSSLGTGLAGLLCGAQSYVGLDVVDMLDVPLNLRLLDELVDLFRRHQQIPDDREFPRLRPRLKSYDFPAGILPGERLDPALADERVECIRQCLTRWDGHEQGGIRIRYVAPWNDPAVVENASVDFLMSHAVLMYIEDLPGTFRAFAQWLDPGGFMSHLIDIDFTAGGSVEDWNGHWACSDFAWRLIKGNRPYFVNRQPHSEYLRLAMECGFRIVGDVRVEEAPAVPRSRLAKRFRQLSEEDLHTRGALIQAVRATPLADAESREARA